MKRIKDFLHTKIQEDGSPDLNQDGILSPQELHHHLDIQRRGIVDMGDYAAHVLFHSHHPEYLAPYAEKFNDVQKRHAAGEKMCEHDKVMSNLENNGSLKATSYPTYEGKTAKNKDLDPPAVLVMRRKSVRQFPNGQRVALYYIDKLNKYVTVPYDDIEWSAMNEETVFDHLKKVKEENVIVEHLDGTTSEVTPKMANDIMSLYRKISEENKSKLIDMLEASNKHFQTIVKFSKE